MRARTLLATGFAVLAASATASAEPSRYQVETTLAPGQRVALTVGRVPFGEFRFHVRARSTAAVRFGLTQQRGTGRKFAVLAVPSAIAGQACAASGAALVCSNIQTPAPAASANYTFRLRNNGTAPLAVTLTVTWRRVISAG